LAVFSKDKEEKKQVFLALFANVDLLPVLCSLFEKTQPAKEMVDGENNLSKVYPSPKVHFELSSQ
jgi:hypothetical protein